MDSPSFLKLDISSMVTLELVLPVLFTITLDFSVLSFIPYAPVHSAQWFPNDSVSVREWILEFCRRNRGRESSTFRCFYPALAAWWCLLIQLPTCHAHLGVSRFDKRPLFGPQPIRHDVALLLPHDPFIRDFSSIAPISSPRSWSTAKDHRIRYGSPTVRTLCRWVHLKNPPLWLLAAFAALLPISAV